MTNNRIIKSASGATLGKTKVDGSPKKDAISVAEATLQISEHIAAMMYFFFSDSETTTEEEEEFDDITLNLASVLCLSMNLDVAKVNKNGELNVTIKLEDVNKFLREMLSGK